MSILFFRLRGVPEDEADDIRELLNVNGITFYETSAGNWGISLPAIWLHHPDDLPKAQILFDDYQQQRTVTQRALYLELKQQNRQAGFWRHNLKKPFRFLGYCGLLSLILYISIKWLFELGL
ncbi:hypothetical protein IVG45_09195 [Methylomonas sp. LL1]|uniref:DUF6164 family protein n=1 Tax=Methylomonas sp. LL1 TaxID=2785785 RepID=UPI0018C420B9|nr:DUF6164 family protein [Methylomonas sp. LL1]QPK65086.1 hypothetical protein IVG45_09195 [Methylomonas sp. LL1]